jgi:hypothetical protein
MRDFRWKGRSEVGEAVEVGAEDVALQDKVSEFPLAFDADEAGVFQLFHVMGEGGGADGLGFVEAGAGRGAVASADLGEDFVAAGGGQGAGDERELAVGDSVLLRGGCVPLRRDVGPLRRAGTLLCHHFLPYRAEAVGCWRKLMLRLVDIHPALTYCQDMSSSLRIAAQCCCSLLRRVRLEHGLCG